MNCIGARAANRDCGAAGWALLVAGFEVQDGWPAHGQGQLHGFTHDAASDEKLCAEMVALS